MHPAANKLRSEPTITCMAAYMLCPIHWLTPSLFPFQLR